MYFQQLALLIVEVIAKIGKKRDNTIARWFSKLPTHQPLCTSHHQNQQGGWF